MQEVCSMQAHRKCIQYNISFKSSKVGRPAFTGVETGTERFSNIPKFTQQVAELCWKPKPFGF